MTSAPDDSLTVIEPGAEAGWLIVCMDVGLERVTEAYLLDSYELRGALSD